MHRLKIPVTALLLLLFSISLFSFILYPPQRKIKPVVIGYVGGYKGLVNTEQIDAGKLTHINYAFVDVKNNQAFLTNEKTDTVNFRKLNALKKINPHLKILISIGGWAWSENFSDAVLTDASRKSFAVSAVNIIRKHKLDGVDIDWEYPGMPGEEGNIYRPQDKQNFTRMFEALRQELDLLEKQEGNKKLLTTAVAGFAQFLDHTEMDKASRYLDYVNLMTYDLFSGDTAVHHAGLYASALYQSTKYADHAVKAFMEAGVPASKLVLGIPFYGRSFKLQAAVKQGIGEKMISQDYLDGYTLIKDSLVNKNGFTSYRDKAAKVPYLVNAATKQVISYEDEISVREKCKYVMDQQLAGVMFWEYTSDPKGYLLHEIHQTLK
ncbi:glycoside hydrolase family 18 protein [Rhodocytophaga aerolata]|uniref:chitinase n=1 Tax=Rhodocytophaga aerolata TaxID=455078 RepID=A0ABT8RKH8_9BACT|nr:glycoside hydrolase family 18 protein [Rhodocytophaga aerolata]MDO1451392.1 glycoside hydrolase family 18 protein [Rhodocytophaga aerolata]